MEYVLHLCVILCIYALPATSLDLLVGHLGIMSLSHAAFFGVGAYATAIASTTIGVPFPLTTIISIIVGGLLALPVAAVASRLRGDYLLVATFGLQIVMFNVFNNWTAVTGGSLGISKVAPFFSSYERCGVLLALATSVVLLALAARGGSRTVKQEINFFMAIKRRERQKDLWVATSELPKSAGHPFYLGSASYLTSTSSTPSSRRAWDGRRSRRASISAVC